MKIVSGYYVYKVYITYKSHFCQPDADISKYNFGVFNVPYNAFLKTKGIHFYDKIAKVMKKETEVISLFISAFMDNPDTWIGDVCNNLSHYLELKEIREGRIGNIPYTFKRDCIYLLDHGMKFDEGMGTFSMNCFLDSSIQLESFIILRKIFKFNLNDNINYGYLYKGKYEKYECLLNIDIDKYKKILRECILSSK